MEIPNTAVDRIVHCLKLNQTIYCMYTRESVTPVKGWQSRRDAVIDVFTCSTHPWFLWWELQNEEFVAAATAGASNQLILANVHTNTHTDTHTHTLCTISLHKKPGPVSINQLWPVIVNPLAEVYLDTSNSSFPPQHHVCTAHVIQRTTRSL